MRRGRHGHLADVHAITTHAPFAPAPNLCESARYVSLSRAFGVWSTRLRKLQTIEGRVARFLTQTPFRHAWMAEFFRRLCLQPCFEACFTLTAKKRRALSMWVSFAKGTSKTARFLATLGVRRCRHACTRWRQHALGRSLMCVMPVSTEMRAFSLCLQRWIRFCSAAAEERRWWMTANRIVRRRALHKLAARSAEYGEERDARHECHRRIAIAALAQWRRNAVRWREEEALWDEMDARAERRSKRTAWRRMQIACLVSTLHSVADTEGARIQVAGALRFMRASKQRQHWSAHLERLACSHSTRRTLGAWRRAMRATPRYASNRKRRPYPMPHWEDARQKMLAHEIARHFRFLRAHTAQYAAAAEMARRHGIAARQNALATWRARGIEADALAIGATERARAADSLLVLRWFDHWCAQARSWRLLENCTRAMTRTHGQNACAFVLHTWLMGCAAAERADQTRWAVYCFGRARSATRRWRQNGSARVCAASMLARAARRATSVSELRMGLRRWRREAHSQLAKAAMLSQRARLVRVATRLAAAMRRWQAARRAHYWARRPTLVFGFIGWRRLRRRKALKRTKYAAAGAVFFRRAARRALQCLASSQPSIADKHRLWSASRRLWMRAEAAFAERSYVMCFLRWRREVERGSWAMLSITALLFSSGQRLVSESFRGWRLHAARRKLGVARARELEPRVLFSLARIAMRRWRRAHASGRGRRRHLTRSAAEAAVAAGHALHATIHAFAMWRTFPARRIAEDAERRRRRRLARAAPRPERMDDPASLGGIDEGEERGGASCCFGMASALG